jgi:hypothetical protein
LVAPATIFQHAADSNGAAIERARRAGEAHGVVAVVDCPVVVVLVAPSGVPPVVVTVVVVVGVEVDVTVVVMWVVVVGVLEVVVVCVVDVVGVVVDDVVGGGAGCEAEEDVELDAEWPEPPLLTA